MNIELCILNVRMGWDMNYVSIRPLEEKKRAGLERWTGKGQPDSAGSFSCHREFGFISGKLVNIGGFRAGKLYNLTSSLKISLITPCSC